MTKYLKLGLRRNNKNVLGNTGTKTLPKGGQKIQTKDVKGTYLTTFSLHQSHIFLSLFFFISVCMELRQWLNWSMSMSYEFTLGDWMLSIIINELTYGFSRCVVNFL